MPIKILLVDDHIPITNFFQETLQRLEQPLEIEISNCIETAYHTLFDNKIQPPFDLILLDMSMPNYVEKNINNGEDLGQ